MADLNYVKSIGELITPRLLASSLSWTAGGASDSVTWTGYSIDRGAFANGGLPRSASILVAYDLTLASGSSFALTFDIQDSPDGSNWSDYATEAYFVVATGPSGGGHVSGVARFSGAANNANAPAGTPGVDLAMARRYVRCNVVPHMTRTGTDTGVLTVIGEFGGFDLLAAPKS